MTQTFLRSILGVAVATTIAACGGSATSANSPVNSPVAPSAGGNVGVSTSGATISGTLTGAAGTASAGVSSARSVDVTVTVAGTSISTTVDSNGKFTLTNVPPGNVELDIQTPSGTAVLNLGTVSDQETIHITVTVNGNMASLDNEDNQTPDHEEIEGAVTAVDPTAGSITVDGKTILVTSSTSITQGQTTLTLADIKVGDEVHVKATVSGSTLTATSIEVDSDSGNTEAPGNSNNPPSSNDTPGHTDNPPDHSGNNPGGDTSNK
jgi:hypothetical protein